MRIRFEATVEGQRTVVPGEITRGGATWLWDMLTGQLRNDEGGLSDHIGKGRVIAGDGATVDLKRTRLAGTGTTWAETSAGSPAIRGDQIRFRSKVAAPFSVRELGFTSVQSVLIARTTNALTLPAGPVLVDVVMEFAPSWAPPRRDETLLALV